MSSSEEHIIAYSSRMPSISNRCVIDDIQEIQETYPVSQLPFWSGRHSVISDPYTKMEQKNSVTPHTLLSKKQERQS